MEKRGVWQLPWAAAVVLVATQGMAEGQQAQVTAAQEAAAKEVATLQAAAGTARMRAVGLATAALRSELQSANAGALQTFAQEKLRQGIKRALIERAVTDPLTSSTQAAAEHQLTIVVADKGDVLGRARFYVPLGPQADAQITFAAPLTSSATTFATTEGLAPKAQANLSVKYTVWAKKTEVSETAFSRFGSVVTQAATPATTLAGIELLRQAAANTSPNRELLNAGILAAQADELPVGVRRLLLSPTVVQSPERFYAALAQAQPELVSTSYAAYFLPGVEWNRRVVDYLEPETFASKTFDETGALFTFSAGVSKIAAWRTGSQGEPVKAPVFYAGASFRGGDGADVDDPRRVCRPDGSAGVLECFEQPVGSPVETSLRAVTVELRQWSPAQTLGINPRYTYSRKRVGEQNPSIVHTFEVPVYFMRKVKDVTVPSVDFGADLIGGVNLGWRDSGTREGAFVTLFLSKAFGLP